MHAVVMKAVKLTEKHSRYRNGHEKQPPDILCRQAISIRLKQIFSS